ncbi:MAG: GntR family transcriptional regulator [Kiloniellales bacterium]
MVTSLLNLQAINTSFSLKDRIYSALRESILKMNIYALPGPARLDERQLAEDLGVSRTPLREALARLEQEGFVRTVPRKGVFVVRRSKAEILEIITVWAALEAMAARLAAERATDDEIASLRRMFSTFDGDTVEAKIDEYSDTNLRFHQTILALGRCDLLVKIAGNLLVHMRWIRMRTIGEDHRAVQSIIDHTNIIEAIERRDPELAERLARQHALDLAEHVERHATYLDETVETIVAAPPLRGLDQE